MHILFQYKGDFFPHYFFGGSVHVKLTTEKYETFTLHFRNNLDLLKQLSNQ